jgi:plasmid replication initiation protein
MIDENNELIVRKSNKLINAKGRHKYTTFESYLICTLVATIDDFDEDFNENGFFKYTDLPFLNNNHYDYIYNNCYSLMEKPILVDGGIYHWFSKLKPVDSGIEFSFHKDLKPFLLELKQRGNFTEYYLKNILKLSSSYSIQIYELLQQIIDWKTPKQEFWRTILISDFRDMLNIPKSYDNDAIKKRILEKSKRDLEENTDIKFEYFLEKRGRSFYSIKFKITKNKK